MKIFAAIFLLAAAVLVYAAWVEPCWIQVRQVKIVDSVLAEAWGKIRLMHLSDLHIRKTGRKEKHLLHLVEELHPDLILVKIDEGHAHLVTMKGFGNKSFSKYNHFMRLHEPSDGQTT